MSGCRHGVSSDDRCDFCAEEQEDVIERIRETPCPDGHGGRNGCISQGLAADVEKAGYFCVKRIRAALTPHDERAPFGRHARHLEDL